MKKTVKLLSVLAILLVIFVSCTADITSNGSNGKPSGVINPNIPAAKPEDVDSIIPDLEDMTPGLPPQFSEKYLLANASQSVQNSFVTKLENSKLFEFMTENSKPTDRRAYTEGNFFVAEYTLKEENEEYKLDIMQDSSNGKWMMQSWAESKDPQGNAFKEVYANAMSKGYIVYSDNYVGLKLPADSKCQNSSYSRQTKTDYILQSSYEMTEDEVVAYAESNNLKENTSNTSPSYLIYTLEKPADKMFIKLSWNKESKTAELEYTTDEIKH